jgi:hypothetical protein
LSDSVEANHKISFKLQNTDSSNPLPLSTTTSTLLTFHNESMIGIHQRLKVII